MLSSIYTFIGASVGHCAGMVGCEKAPDLIKEKLALSDVWHDTVYFQSKQRRLHALDELTRFSTALAKETSDVVKQGKKFITIGGDHSCGIGTWTGVHDACGEFGLIWIDAHMDAHTPHTSNSGNLHGMPVATLLGHGSDKLTEILSADPKIKPENVILIGIRSFEEPEQALLKKLGVKISMIEEVNKRGFQPCFDEALRYFHKQNIPFGVSFDLDGLDPEHISALGTPVEDGIELEQVLESFKAMPKEKLIGVEITEYNPMLDEDETGVKVIKEIISSLAS